MEPQAELAKQPQPLVLGSSSVFRDMVMRAAGSTDHEIIAPDIDEQAIRHDNPNVMVQMLAKAKSVAVCEKLMIENRKAIIISSDQVILWDNEIREKPKNEEQARLFILTSGKKPVTTVTGVCAYNMFTSTRWCGVDLASVRFSEFSREEIDELVANPLVFAAAGAFAVGHPELPIFDAHIEEIKGSMDSVIGLPIKLTNSLLTKVGYEGKLLNE